MQPAPSLFPKEPYSKVVRSISRIESEVFGGHGTFVQAEISAFVREFELKRRSREENNILKAKENLRTALNVTLPAIDTILATNTRSIIDIASGLNGSIRNLLSHEDRFRRHQQSIGKTHHEEELKAREAAIEDVARHRDLVDQTATEKIIEAYEKYGFAYPSGADMLGAEAARE